MKLNLFFLFLGFVFFTSCEEFDNRLVVENASDKNVYYYVTSDSFPIFKELEKMNRLGIKYTYQNYFSLAKSHAKDSSTIMGNWERRFMKENCKCLQIFVYNEDTLKLYDFNLILQERKYALKRRIYLDELIKSNWVVKVE